MTESREAKEAKAEAKAERKAEAAEAKAAKKSEDSADPHGGVKLRILTRCSTELGTFYKGDEPDLPAHEAERLMSLGWAIDLREKLQARTQGQIAIDEETGRRARLQRRVQTTDGIVGDQGRVESEGAAVEREVGEAVNEAVDEVWPGQSKVRKS
jgi:hypothetical protein